MIRPGAARHLADRQPRKWRSSDAIWVADTSAPDGLDANSVPSVAARAQFRPPLDTIKRKISGLVAVMAPF